MQIPDQYKTPDLSLAAYLFTQRPSINFDGTTSKDGTRKEFVFSPRDVCEKLAFSFLYEGATVNARALTEAVKMAKTLVHS